LVCGYDSTDRIATDIYKILKEQGPECLIAYGRGYAPEVIFFCGGNANYLYNKVLKLSKKYNVKIVYYITDDHVLPYFSFNIFNIINRIRT
jgi:hypothetical protein